MALDPKKIADLLAQGMKGYVGQLKEQPVDIEGLAAATLGKEAYTEFLAIRRRLQTERRLAEETKLGDILYGSVKNKD